jgi:arsenical pump membrane protein
LAAVRAAEAEPLPYLLICAFIANAASFVLPISNPANLVLYQSQMPTLGRWLATFSLPSVAAILATFSVLFCLARKSLNGEMKQGLEIERLKPSGRLTFWGIGGLAIALLTASAFNRDLGWPAFGCGALVLLIVALRDKRAVSDVAINISWSVLPLVGGLFVIVEGVSTTRALLWGAGFLRTLAHDSAVRGSLTAGFGIALLSNLTNNLPSGLIAGATVRSAGIVGPIRDALLVGVDLGPNLSISGSLATILWLTAIRREGMNVEFWRFLRWGMLVMPPALLVAILALLFAN